MLNRTRSFTELYTRLGFAMLVILAVTMTGINVYESYRDFSRRAENMRRDYIASQKEIVKEEVFRAVSMIKYRLSEVDKIAEKEASAYLSRLYHIAEYLYGGYSGKIDSLLIEEIITGIFESHTEEAGDINLYIMDSNGKLVTASSGFPSVSRKEIADEALRGNKGMIELFMESGSRRDLHYRYFTPLKLVLIGLVNKNILEERIKKEILNEISMIRFGSQGYIFVNRAC